MASRASTGALHLFLVVALVQLAGCHASSHTRVAGADADPALAAATPLGATPSVRVGFERMVAANWSVPLSGLLDLDHPRAVAAGLEDALEPIEIAVYVIRHPSHGIWLIDSGVAAHFAPGEDSGLSWIVEQAMGMDRLDLKLTIEDLVADLEAQPSGVLLTHMHLDHVMGASGLPEGVPVFAGPGEGAASSWTHLLTRGSIDAQLEDREPVQELALAPDPQGRFVAGLDLFGDGSVQVLHVPGHTPGSLAFLVHAEDGDHLLLGDASHTAWGWRNGVQPGSYTLDPVAGADSLARLRALAAERPDLRVHPGHQSLSTAAASVSAAASAAASAAP